MPMARAKAPISVLKRGSRVVLAKGFGHGGVSIAHGFGVEVGHGRHQWRMEIAMQDAGSKFSLDRMRKRIDPANRFFQREPGRQCRGHQFALRFPVSGRSKRHGQPAREPLCGLQRKRVRRRVVDGAGIGLDGMDQHLHGSSGEVMGGRSLKHRRIGDDPVGARAGDRLALSDAHPPRQPEIAKAGRNRDQRKAFAPPQCMLRGKPRLPHGRSSAHGDERVCPDVAQGAQNPRRCVFQEGWPDRPAPG